MTFFSSPSSKTTTTAIATTTAALALGVLLWKKRSKQRKQQCHTAADLKGNWHATAQDVLRIYGSITTDDDGDDDNQTSKIYVITGTTSGLGKQCALLLGEYMSTNCQIIMGVRDMERGRQVQEQINNTAASGAGKNSTKATVFHLDLESLQSVRAFAANVKDFLSKNKQTLDGIINNAGCFQTPGFTADGYQITWQTNAMAPALLTELLLPHLSKDGGRVIHVSSDMHKLLLGWSADRITSQCPPKSSGSSQVDYALSKACQILHTTHLQNRFDAEAAAENNNDDQTRRKRRAFAVDPGLVRTNVARNVPAWMQWLEYSVIGFFMLRTMDEGCATILYCLLAPFTDLDDDRNDANKRNIYFGACAAKEPKRACLDPDQAAALTTIFHKAWGEASLS